MFVLLATFDLCKLTDECFSVLQHGLGAGDHSRSSAAPGRQICLFRASGGRVFALPQSVQHQLANKAGALLREGASSREIAE